MSFTRMHRLAQDHLLRGDVDVMLAGASCLPEPFFILSGFSAFQAMPVKQSEHGDAAYFADSLPLRVGSQACVPMPIISP